MEADRPPRTSSTKSSPIYRRASESLPISPRLLRAAQPPLVTPVGCTSFNLVHPLSAPARWLTADQADIAEVTLIQRFGSAVNLNIHLYRPMLARRLRARRGRFGFRGDAGIFPLAGAAPWSSRVPRRR